MADDELPQPPRKKGGRPRNPEPGARVSTWMPASEHDRLCRLALQRDESVSSLVRRILTARRQPPHEP